MMPRQDRHVGRSRSTAAPTTANPVDEALHPASPIVSEREATLARPSRAVSPCAREAEAARKRPARSTGGVGRADERRVRARVSEVVKLPPVPSEARWVVRHSAHGFDVRAPECRGFAVFRGVGCDAQEASAVYTELSSEQASRLSWTALRDGGNSDSLLDTMKCYCGETSQMLARGGRYRQQLLVRGRRADPLLSLPAISTVRRKMLNLIAKSITESVAPARGAPAVSLLTEQLIKYLPSDRWFAPHWDKDRRDKSSEPLDPKAYDGPGDALATLCLGCPCTLLMLPRHGNSPGFALELEPGDVYMLTDEARWEWKHGIAISETETVGRRAIVWRLLVDENDAQSASLE
ncbi:hypothetical protein AB1Y20_005295 [Prymnesium parvum]|uniref:Alpha-ketoglutarate-dependent dioxygenase AlkB-like domain-containing protein n=1 Tax=Prymnesium parvum TaxID=97485 RepID=A0AB34J5E7_PRYPA